MLFRSSVLPTIGFTEVTSDLYYQGGYLATLKIPSIDVNVKVYELSLIHISYL